MGLYSALLLASLGVFACEGTSTSSIEYAVKPLPLQQRQCPSLQERKRVRDEIAAEVSSILDSSPVLYTCNGSPGWRRVGFFDMTDPSQDCPPGLNVTSQPIRTCRSSHTTNGACSSTTFNVSGMEYQQVCGRIRAYQRGSTQAFVQFLQFNKNLENAYVDGISLTHGAVGERQHIWTFAAGISELLDGLNPRAYCPCDSTDHDQPSTSPPFVGEDYFCESANNVEFNPFSIFFGDDPLWDGEGCVNTVSNSCCQFNSPPWFTKTLPLPTTDDIELRLCHLISVSGTDVPIELVELYIK